MIYPYAHLSSSLSTPATAVKIVQVTDIAIAPNSLGFH